DDLATVIDTVLHHERGRDPLRVVVAGQVRVVRRRRLAQPVRDAGVCPDLVEAWEVGTGHRPEGQPLGPHRPADALERRRLVHPPTLDGVRAGGQRTTTLLCVKTFEELWAELADKAERRPAGSGTVAQLNAGVHAIGKKLVEEAAESWMAAEHETSARTAEEISQLLYHAQVLMLATGLTLDDVYAHL